MGIVGLGLGIIVHTDTGVTPVHDFGGEAVVGDGDGIGIHAIGGDGIKILEITTDAELVILHPSHEGRGHGKTQVQRETAGQVGIVGKIALVKVGPGNSRCIIREIRRCSCNNFRNGLPVDGPIIVS